jgi:hypothetical protein
MNPQLPLRRIERRDAPEADAAMTRWPATLPVVAQLLVEAVAMAYGMSKSIRVDTTPRSMRCPTESRSWRS